MRSLYFILGLLIGMFYVAEAGINSCNLIDDNWIRNITPYTLTGFYEGWQRGRIYTEARMRWIWEECSEEKEHHKRNASKN